MRHQVRTDNIFSGRNASSFWLNFPSYSPSSHPSTMLPANLFFFFIVIIVLATAAQLVAAERYDYPTANHSTRWVNSAAALQHSVGYPDRSAVRAIVLRSPKTFYGPSFAAGFFCAAPCDAFLFAVFIVYTNSGAGITLTTTGIPQVVWSANRARPVRENATLELTYNGSLVLRDADGSLVWSSSSSGQSVAGMEITDTGNLVLFDQRNVTVWQSFDHPTDTLLPGQSLMEGMKLRANSSMTNLTENQVYMAVQPDGLFAYVESTPPQLYYSHSVSTNKTGKDPTKVTFTDGSLSIFVQSTQPSNISLPPGNSTQYMRLEFDGHLRLYEWSNTEAKWTVASDVIKVFPDDCAFPVACGKYGICTGGQCTCPLQGNSSLSYFKPVDERKANLGCAPLTPISCQEMQSHRLLTLTDVSYFDFSHTILNATNRDDCKESCLKSCSCRAVIFRYGQNDSDGTCFLVLEVFSLQTIQPEALHYNSSAYLKVQLSPSASASGYLAPEWLTSQITEKVDVYSFGVVLLEIICGRKSIDISQPEESVQLINLLREKAQNNQLIDIIDKQSTDMVSHHQEEVIQMMKLAMWCLQNDSSQRPSMSMVVKVLEGAMSVENRLDYSFVSANSVISVQDNPSTYSAPPSASILSGGGCGSLAAGDGAQN